MKDLEDKVYVEQAIEKRQPKVRQVQVVKQKLVFKKEVKAQLEDPNLNNQEKALILVNDLAEKLDRKPVDKPKPV